MHRQAEYLLKGIFLGLVLYLALLHPDWPATAAVALYLLGGLVVALGLALVRHAADLPRLLVRPHTYLLFLVLENPFLVYAGTVVGFALGCFALQPDGVEPWLLARCVGGGALAGVVMGILPAIQGRPQRLGAGVIAGALALAGLSAWLGAGDFFDSPERQRMLGVHLLLGLPFFYLLVFAARAEESEGEIAALCTVMGLALGLIQQGRADPARPDEIQAGKLTLLLPLAVYFAYATRLLGPLRVFKHVVRGYSYTQMRKVKPALVSFRRALHLDPNNALASQGMEYLHLFVDLDRLDAATLGLLDAQICLNRVRKALAQKPGADDRAKALKLLALTEKQDPKRAAQVQYFRAVLATHDGDLDAACAGLADLLDPDAWFPTDVYRKATLFEAWQLGLRAHPVLRERVGLPQLQLPGRAMEAIGAVEYELSRTPGEPPLLDIRRELFGFLREEDYAAFRRQGSPVYFDYAFCRDYAQELLPTDEWRRGAGLLRVAIGALPEQAPALWQQLAKAYAEAGDPDEATKCRRAIRDIGLGAGGPSQLPGDQRGVYFAAVKALAEEAAAAGDADEAILDYSLYTQYEGSGLETLRQLAAMYERKADVLEALRVTEKALLYDGSDADLLARKDRYAYSLTPEALAEARDGVKKWFDVKYCLRKAKTLLDARDADLDLLDWADHLLKLAVVMEPKSVAVLALAARLALRRGERLEGVRLLEDIVEMKPPGGDETEAWYLAHKQLGKLYLDELGRPDLAVAALEKYAGHNASGAETLYDLARACEASGERTKALRYYREVTVYDHPLKWEAEAAVRRLKEAAPA